MASALAGRVGRAVAVLFELTSEAQAVVVIWTSPVVFNCEALWLLITTQPLIAIAVVATAPMIRKWRVN